MTTLLYLFVLSFVWNYCSVNNSCFSYVEHMLSLSHYDNNKSCPLCESGCLSVQSGVLSAVSALSLSVFWAPAKFASIRWNPLCCSRQTQSGQTLPALQFTVPPVLISCLNYHQIRSNSLESESIRLTVLPRVKLDWREMIIPEQLLNKTFASRC